MKFEGEYNKHFEPVSKSTIDRNLTKLKLTRKKKTLFDPRKHSPDNQKKRQDYDKNIDTEDPKALIFIDETGCVRNLTRSHARSPQGQRAHCENSLNRGTRISTIGALKTDGILTAFCYEGTLTAFLFACQRISGAGINPF
ncbi:MAG: transposase [Candidatus Parabeggiatoa sp.]|nr:transposase [Candidatus Parabeggiatoa sp.]